MENDLILDLSLFSGSNRDNGGHVRRQSTQQQPAIGTSALIHLSGLALEPTVAKERHETTPSVSALPTASPPLERSKKSVTPYRELFLRRRRRRRRRRCRTLLSLKPVPLEPPQCGSSRIRAPFSRQLHTSFRPQPFSHLKLHQLQLLCRRSAARAL